MSENRSIITADIGGTNGRFALIDFTKEEDMNVAVQQTFRCEDHDSLGTMIQLFMGQHDVGNVRHALLALAGQASRHEASITNLGWSMTSEALQSVTGLDSVTFMNDFEAVAHAVPHLHDDDFLSLKSGTYETSAPISVMGPGTGFGVAQLVPVQDGKYNIISTEGGHIGFAPATHLEQDLWAHLKKQRDHVCVESLLSGRGLVRIHDFLVEYAGAGTKGLGPEEISREAVGGNTPSCARAVQVFLSILGNVAGDLALAQGARGGVWLAGGIVPKIFNLIEASDLIMRFGAKGIMSSYLKNIPINVITNTNVALIGAAAAWLDTKAP